MNKTIIALAMIVTVALTAQLPLAAQTKPTKQQKRAAKVADEIGKLGTGEKAKVRVKLYSGTVHQGYVARTDSEGFDVVGRTGKSDTVRYADVRSIGGSNLSTGAKIGIGVGFGAGITLLIFLALLEYRG